MTSDPWWPTDKQAKLQSTVFTVMKPRRRKQEEKEGECWVYALQQLLCFFLLCLFADVRLFVSLVSFCLAGLIYLSKRHESRHLCPSQQEGRRLACTVTSLSTVLHVWLWLGWISRTVPCWSKRLLVALLYLLIPESKIILKLSVGSEQNSLSWQKPRIYLTKKKWCVVGWLYQFIRNG